MVCNEVDDTCLGESVSKEVLSKDWSLMLSQNHGFGVRRV